MELNIKVKSYYVEQHDLTIDSSSFDLTNI